MEQRPSRKANSRSHGYFSLHQRVQTGSVAHFLSSGYQGLFPWGVKRPRFEADHSPPSISEVKNAWSYTSSLSIHLHGVVLRKTRENFTFYPSISKIKIFQYTKCQDKERRSYQLPNDIRTFY